MNLVIFQDYLRQGGTEHQSVALAKFAAERGHRVTLLTCRPGGHIKVPASVNRIALQPFDSLVDEWTPGLARILKKISPDIVLCMGQVANSKIPSLRRLKLLSDSGALAKLVATVRTGKRLKRKLISCYAHADKILTNSFALQGVLETFGLRGRVEVVGNGTLIQPTVDPAARVLLRHKMGANEETTVVVCLQRFVWGKNQHYLMECFLCSAHSSNAQLWLVGRGPTYYLMKAYAYFLDPTRIKVMRPVAPFTDYYNAADMAATASHEDALPNFLIEAHAFGLSAVCEDYAGCGEVVVNGISGFVSPVDDDTTMIAALSQLIHNPNLRALMGENARRLSFRFSFSQQMDRFLSHLEGLCAR